MNSFDFWQYYGAGERNFRGANLSNISLENKVIKGVDLRQANLEKVYISGPIFQDSNLENPNFSELQATLTHFEGCDMSNSTFIKYRIRN